MIGSPDASSLQVPNWLAKRLRCPDCHAPELQEIGSGIVCTRCKTAFPLVKGRPVLIRTDNDLFPPSSYSKLSGSPASSPSSLVARLAPSRSVNMAYSRNLRAFATALDEVGATSVLVLGAGGQKSWLDRFFEGHPTIRIAYSDVASAVWLPQQSWSTSSIPSGLRLRCTVSS